MYSSSTAQLIAIRLLIGLFEAGFYPTAVFYLSTFYTRFDLAVRIALFYGQYAIAGAFSGAIGKYRSKPQSVNVLTRC
jgi:MFS family permease